MSHTHTCTQHIFLSFNKSDLNIAHYWWKILSRADAKKKRKRLKGFKFRTFLGFFSNDVMAVKGLMQESFWRWQCSVRSNSKHWFTTSFLQPLPYLVTPQGPENCQLTSIFVVVGGGAQIVVSLLRTTQIKQGASCIAANKVDTSANKTTIVSIETELFFFFSFFSFFFFLPGVDASHVYVCALVLGCFYSHIGTRTFRRTAARS